MVHLLPLPLALLTVLAGCSADTDVPAATEASSAGQPPVTAPSVAGGPEAARVAETLRAAAAEGRTAAVREALDEGADVNATDPDGRTPLMFAAFEGHTETASLLLERGARVDDRDAMGRTALMFCSTGAFADTVALLLESGADPNAADDSETWTPLMFAAGEGQIEVARLLLDHGADPRKVDADGDGAADHALTRGHTELEQILRQAAAGD